MSDKTIPEPKWCAYCQKDTHSSRECWSQHQEYALKAPLLAEIDRLKAQVAELQKDATPDQIIELTQALEIRRILEEIKEAASIMPQSDMPTQFASGWHEACAEIFYRATGCQWHMDEDDEKFKTNKEQK